MSDESQRLPFDHVGQANRRYILRWALDSRDVPFPNRDDAAYAAEMKLRTRIAEQQSALDEVLRMRSL